MEAQVPAFLHINVVERRWNTGQCECDEGSRLLSGQVGPSRAAHRKWPVTRHTRRHPKTDHLRHVQKYLRYGWLK